MPESGLPESGLIEVEIDGVVMEKKVIEYGLLDKLAGGAHAQADRAAVSRASVGVWVLRSKEWRVGSCVEATHRHLHAVSIGIEDDAIQAE